MTVTWNPPHRVQTRTMLSPLWQLRIAYAGLLGMTIASNFLDVPVHVHMITDCILIIHIGCLGALSNEPVRLGRTGKAVIAHSEVRSTHTSA